MNVVCKGIAMDNKGKLTCRRTKKRPNEETQRACKERLTLLDLYLIKKQSHFLCNDQEILLAKTAQLTKFVRYLSLGIVSTLINLNPMGGVVHFINLI